MNKNKEMIPGSLYLISPSLAIFYLDSINFENPVIIKEPIIVVCISCVRKEQYKILYKNIMYYLYNDYINIKEL